MAESWPSPRCQRQWQGLRGGTRGSSHPPLQQEVVFAKVVVPRAQEASLRALASFCFMNLTPVQPPAEFLLPVSAAALVPIWAGLPFWSLWAAGGSLPKPPSALAYRVAPAWGCKSPFPQQQASPKQPAPGQRAWA